LVTKKIITMYFLIFITYYYYNILLRTLYIILTVNVFNKQYFFIGIYSKHFDNTLQVKNKQFILSGKFIKVFRFLSKI